MYYVWMEGKRKTVRGKRKENWVVLLLFSGQSKICMHSGYMLGKSKMFGSRRNTLGKKYVFILQATDKILFNCVNSIFGLCLVNLVLDLKGEVLPFLACKIFILQKSKCSKSWLSSIFVSM